MAEIKTMQNKTHKLADDLRLCSFVKVKRNTLMWHLFALRGDDGPNVYKFQFYLHLIIDPSACIVL